ncbi:MAG: ribosome small subunit-dependent GTPase A [Erysipelothrix sp.]|nr:ribosome small subunit-dependent GTPase A [Erysipelothrix sp.]
MTNVGLIVKNISNRYTVYIDGQSHIAVAMGKLRLGKRPLVGDHVSLEMIDGNWVIQEVLERHNELKRPLVSNVDQVLIVMSAKEPDFSYRLVDRLIFLVAIEGVKPVIVINKIDLEEDAVIEKIKHEYEDYGYKVVLTGKYDTLTEFTALFKDKITVLAGQSGVGKSSIINRIDKSFTLQTQEISKVLGRGKHTTRHNQLHAIAGGWVADTPGFSSLDFKHIDKSVLAQSVPDFKAYWEDCKFRNCSHNTEPGCAVKAAIDKKQVSKQRYEHYLEVLELIKGDRHE